MMPSPQRAKGNSWEREIALMLSETYGTNFMRSPGSGAYIGGTNSHRKQILSEGQVRSFKGDIIPGTGFERLNIECKSYRDFSFHQILSGTTNKQLDSWIEQSMEVADPGDFTVLFMKFTRQGTYIATTAQQTLKLPPHGTHYKSQRHGTWFFSDLKTFMELNQDVIRELSRPSQNN